MPYLLVLWLLIGTSAHAQSPPEESDSLKKIKLDERYLRLGLEKFDERARGNRGIRVVFYNVENLFDTEDDPDKRDDDFTPKGLKGWTYSRYIKKLNNIYKTVMAVGGWEPPAAIGFCEVENRRVVEDLLKKTPLRKFKYGIVHESSPDKRGIDVAFIYRSDKFKYIEHDIIRVNFPFDTSLKTRDVLHVRGSILGKDTLDLFVNHWPSRWGGQAKSEPKRTYVASLVRAKVNQLYAENPNSKIVIMGDLNDEVKNKSVIEVLNAKASEEELDENGLLDYMFELSKNWKLGSHKYRTHWGIIDHILVSTPLVRDQRKGKLRASSLGAQIFAARFLLEQDIQYLGLKPFRTYAGPRFLDGFSDHMPIYIDLFFNSVYN